MSFPTGQSNLKLYTSGDCNNGTQRKRDKKTFTRTGTRQKNRQCAYDLLQVSDKANHQEGFRAWTASLVARYLSPAVQAGDKQDITYFFKESRISVSSSTSAEGAGGAAGASSSCFFMLFIALTTINMANAMMMKSTTVWVNAP